MQNKVKELFRKYGKTAVAVHFTVYFTTFGGAGRYTGRAIAPHRGLESGPAVSIDRPTWS